MDRAAYGRIAHGLEAELRAVNLWRASPPDAPITGPFGADTATFAEWLQFVLVPRLRGVEAGTDDPPASSSVGARALREYDGATELDPLVDLLIELDELVRTGGDASARGAR